VVNTLFLLFLPVGRKGVHKGDSSLPVGRERCAQRWDSPLPGWRKGVHNGEILLFRDVRKEHRKARKPATESTGAQGRGELYTPVSLLAEKLSTLLNTRFTVGGVYPVYSPCVRHCSDIPENWGRTDGAQRECQECE